MENAPEPLAHWQYTPEMWADFLKQEKGVFKGGVKAAEHFMIGTILVAGSLFVCIVVLPAVFAGTWNIGPAGAIGVLAFIALAAGFIARAIRVNKFQKISENKNGLLISLNEIKLQELDLNWTYAGDGWRFLSGERKTMEPGSGKSINVIELSFVAYFPSKGSPVREVVEWRIPIPPGKELEADRIIERFRDERAASEQKWITDNASLGHSFDGERCSKCDRTFEYLSYHSKECF